MRELCRNCMNLIQKILCLLKESIETKIPFKVQAHFQIWWSKLYNEEKIMSSSSSIPSLGKRTGKSPSKEKSTPSTNLSELTHPISWLNLDFLLRRYSEKGSKIPPCRIFPNSTIKDFEFNLPSLPWNSCSSWKRIKLVQNEHSLAFPNAKSL